MADGGGDESDSDGSPTDETVVQRAAEAAEEVIFSRLDRDAVEDLDVTVTFEDRRLEVDVYLNAPSARADTDQIAEDAVLAARVAADDLLEG